MRKYFFLFFPVLLTLRLAAQDDVKHVADSLANKYIKAYGGALVIGINVKGQEQIFTYGETAKGSHQRPDATTIFEIGDVTEVFTAIIFADMSVKGEVNADDPLQKYLPVEVPSPVYQHIVCKPVPENENNRIGQTKEGAFIKYTPYVCTPDASSVPQPIIVCYLATHTSGLPEYPDNLNMKKNSDNPFASYTKDNLYDFLRGYIIPKPIGYDYRHSPAGIAILGHVLTLQAGKDYETLLIEKILEPLGMNNTRIALSGEQNKKFVDGHRANGKPTPHWTFDIMVPAAGLRSDLADMMKFLAANTGTTATAEKGLLDYTHNTRIKFSDKKNIETEAALGWLVSPLGTTQKMVWKEGHTGGFAAAIAFVETSHTGVVILSNTNISVKKMSETILAKMNE